MSNIKFMYGDDIPLEMHKARVVQKLKLLPARERQKAISKAGNNTFLLKNRDVFLDMLTDSGTNAMSNNQQAAMMRADDSYAGSETFQRLEDAVDEIFDKKHFLPAHQGRACEHIISKVLVEPGSTVPMNYHFTTSKAHIVLQGGKIEELLTDEGLDAKSRDPFKGDIDIDKLRRCINTEGAENIAFVRMEAGTNLIGGQPFSLENLCDVKDICEKFGLSVVLDASLLADNIHFILKREECAKEMTPAEIAHEISNNTDIIYFSGRKLGCARGGGMCLDDDDLYEKFREFVPLYEGFLTYGGMSVREMEAMAVGLIETLDEDVINQGPDFIEFMVEELHSRNIPVVLPPGGLGAHVDAKEFVDHIPQTQYPAAALASAMYIISGVRGMERGTLAEERDEDGNEQLADMELLRLALPRRVFTLSQIKYTVDRLQWLYENRRLIEGLRFTDEPNILRFFFGKLEPISDWQKRLVEKFEKDFGTEM